VYGQNPGQILHLTGRSHCGYFQTRVTQNRIRTLHRAARQQDVVGRSVNLVGNDLVLRLFIPSPVQQHSFILIVEPWLGSYAGPASSPKLPLLESLTVGLQDSPRRNFR